MLIETIKFKNVVNWWWKILKCNMENIGKNCKPQLFVIKKRESFIDTNWQPHKIFFLFIKFLAQNWNYFLTNGGLETFDHWHLKRIAIFLYLLENGWKQLKTINNSKNLATYSRIPNDLSLFNNQNILCRN